MPIIRKVAPPQATTKAPSQREILRNAYDALLRDCEAGGGYVFTCADPRETWVKIRYQVLRAAARTGRTVTTIQRPSRRRGWAVRVD